MTDLHGFLFVTCNNNIPELQRLSHSFICLSQKYHLNLVRDGVHEL